MDQNPTRKRRQFTPKLTAEALRLCLVGDRSVPHGGRDLDLTEMALRKRVKRLAFAPPAGPGVP